MRVTWVGAVLWFCGTALATSGAPFRSLSRLPLGLTPRALHREDAAGKASGPRRRDRLTLPEARVEPMARDGSRVVLPGAPVLLVEHMPEAPVVVRRFPLEPGKTAVVTLSNVSSEESADAVAVSRVPEPPVWSGDHDFDFGTAPTGRYFPGKLFDAHESDGELVVTVFPVQFDLQTGKVVVVRSADMEIALSDKPAEDEPVGALFATESVILTTEAMRDAASVLQKFHWETFGVSSDVVTVEAIARTEAPVSEDELPDGYKQREPSDKLVVPWDPVRRVGYDYELARKIIAFLRKRMTDASSTRYVTLLGDGAMVPPSYYFSIRGGHSSRFGVTDLCYAAKKQCLEPRLAVGRLPFTSKGEVENYLGKLTRWLELGKQASSEISFFAGKAFPGDVFLGELGALKVLNRESAGWRGARKFFRSKSNYNRANVLDMVSGRGPSPLVYHLDHGNGNQWCIDRTCLFSEDPADYLSSEDVLALAKPGDGASPFVVSIACTAAAFDPMLMKEPLFSVARHGKDAVGVALLKSRAGAVGYLGSARPAIGAAIFSVDQNGNLNLSGTNYGLQLLDTILAKYEAVGSGRVGDIVLRGLKAYAGELGNDFRNPRHVWTLLNAELLGDPVVPLPRRAGGEKAFPLARSTTAFDAGRPPVFPKFFLPAKEKTITVDSAARATATLVKILPTVTFEKGEEIVETKGLANGTSRLPFSSSETQETVYLLRVENDEGVPVERQIWFRVAPREEGDPAVP